MEHITKNIIELPFSLKYDKQHAQYYQKKHHQGLSRKISNWREIQVARKALILAGQPELVLDLPCGAGRFWPMLKEKQSRTVIAADNSAAMITVAEEANPWHRAQKISCIQTSVFDIDLPDASVDSILCMRLIHHIGKKKDRRAMLKELHRVTKDTVIISMWVDGNYKAWRRRQQQKERRREDNKEQNRYIIRRATIEKEFHECGFEIVSHLDLLPIYQMWRTYVIRKL